MDLSYKSRDVLSVSVRPQDTSQFLNNLEGILGGLGWSRAHTFFDSDTETRIYDVHSNGRGNSTNSNSGIANFGIGYLRVQPTQYFDGDNAIGVRQNDKVLLTVSALDDTTLETFYSQANSALKELY